jgi:hypothetical protein
VNIKLQNFRPGLLTFSGFSIALIVAGTLVPCTFSGDSGDSIMHYLYAYYAFSHPELYFDHWAKPFYVLLCSPFASLGFQGAQLFTILCFSGTVCITWRIALLLGLKYHQATILFFIFSPLYFQMAFSGLTEYLFGLFLATSILLVLRQRLILSFIIISFLPLVRSEGLIMIIVFMAYAISQKRWKDLPWFLAGQIVYTLAGSFFHKNIFWVISAIPYASNTSPYGRGGLTDMVHRLNFVIEKPIYLLMICGLVSIVVLLCKKDSRQEKVRPLLLIAAIFLAYFVAHSFFWWRGIFNSMGLPRVFLAVMPTIVLLALQGLNSLIALLPKFEKLFIAAILLLIVIYPFVPRKNGLVYDQTLFVISENELFEKQVRPFLQKAYPLYERNFMYYSHPYVSLSLTHDWFNPAQHAKVRQLGNGEIPANTLLVWDYWFAPQEDGLSWEKANKDPRIKLVREFRQNNKVIFAVFEAG